MRILNDALIKLIRSYQICTPANIRCRCKFIPTCSEYAILALQRYHIFKALALISYRLIRCSPLSKGGIDYPDKS